MAVNERVFVAQPVPLAGGRIVAAPFQFYTTGEDRLRVVSVNSLAGVVLAIHSRMVDSAGVIQANAERHVPNTDRSVATTEHEIGIGALLNLTVFASTGAPVVGQTFVIVQLIRGVGAAAIVLGTLLQGYVTSTQQLSWPGSPIETSTAGEPYVRIITGTLPAAGGEISETVPTGARWELITLRTGFVTSAAAGNRELRLRIRSGGLTCGDYVVSAAVPPLTSQGVTFAQNIPTLANAPSATMQAGVVAPMLLIAGMQFATVTTNLDAADQWQAPNYIVREWQEGP